MKIRHWLFLGVVSAAIMLSVSLFQNSPGYMDADYYYAGGLRLYHGFGFSEPFLWNYLDDPQGLPHPSHTYWMPLSSILAFLGMRLAGSDTFAAARIGFLLIAILIPIATAWLAYSFTGQRASAILSGCLAMLPGFYLSYLGTTDSFGIAMLLGAGFFLMSNGSNKMGVKLQALSLGVLAGLMHLARADGMTWLLLSMLVVNKRVGEYVRDLNPATPFVTGRLKLIHYLLCLLGYGIAFGPWMLRNYLETGTPLSVGGWKTLWLLDYDELFSYPATLVTPARWWSSGLAAIGRARLDALWQNIQTALVVQGEIYLAPLIGIGFWLNRRQLRVRIGLLGWCLVFLIMTVVFPFVGWRGGFFHSGAAFQPLLWAVAPTGLEGFIRWGARNRGWNAQQARLVFSVSLIVLSVFLSVFAVGKRVIGEDFRAPIWDQSWRGYVRIEEELRTLGANPDDIVLVNNPPGYYVASGRSAIAIPNGGVETVCRAAQQYAAGYMILEINHPAGLAALYTHPENQSCLNHLAEVDGAHVFQIIWE